jgi:metal-sulfur cluster biosynthetic enzyme
MVKKKAPTVKDAWKALEEVLDPELGIDIVNLGLIYEVKLVKGIVKVKMTFTTPACPLVPAIAGQAEQKLFKLGFKDVHIHVTWDPPWTAERMSEKAKAILGM